MAHLVPGQRRAVDRARADVRAPGDDRCPDRGAHQDRGHLGHDDLRRIAGHARLRLDLARSGDGREHERIGVVGRQEAGAREKQEMRRLGRAEALAGRRPEGDLAAVETAKREAEPEALGDEREVVGRFSGVGEHGGDVPSQGSTRTWIDPPRR